jgi:urease subunit alpha
MMAEPVRVGPQIAAAGAAPGRVSLAFLAGAAMDADIPTTRERARVAGCRGLTARNMVRNGRTGTITVDAEAGIVRLDGEPLTCAPAAEVPYSGRYLL